MTIILTTGVIHVWSPNNFSCYRVIKCGQPLPLCCLGMCRYGGLWKNLHKADKLPNSSHKDDIEDESLNELESHSATKEKT